jgi:membrane protease YdiL (CAAX protease family)
VLLCSGFPTQIGLGQALSALGLYRSGDPLSLSYVVLLSLADSVLLIGLIIGFLRAHGERPREVFFGGRPLLREAMAGFPMVFVAFAIALSVLLLVQLVAPWLHTVDRNPLQDLIASPRDAALFAIVVVVAGGIREELQRAFLLKRFEDHLGGPVVGVVVASVAFGAGHLLQGADAALATGLLGAFWGVTYLQRRSVMAPVVSHSGFNLLQLVQFIVIGR